MPMTVPIAQETEATDPASLSLYRRLVQQHATKMTPQVCAKLLECISKGMTPKDASSLVGIHVDTLLRYIRKHPLYASQVDRAYVGFKAKHVANIDNFAKVDWKASSWLLERQHPNEYAPKAQLNINGKHDVRISVTGGGYIPHVEATTVDSD